LRIYGRGRKGSYGQKKKAKKAAAKKQLNEDRKSQRDDTQVESGALPGQDRTVLAADRADDFRIE
jgi:hypothetical protein